MNTHWQRFSCHAGIFHTQIYGELLRQMLYRRTVFVSAQMLNTSERRTQVKTFSSHGRLASNESDEFIYGYSSVLAALHAKKRDTMHSVYLQQPSKEKHKHATKKKDSDLLDSVLELCKQSKVPIRNADKGYLNNLTQNKPHQGVVLRTTPRHTVDIVALTTLRPGTTEYTAIGSDKHSQPIPLTTQNNRHAPLWLALDQVQDPQNLGSILRTAYFFGVDGVILCSKNSAPLSPAVSKVSAGAMELMDIYATANLVKFLNASGEHGWTILGADAVDSATVEESEINHKPRILVLGNEGNGLRTNVRKCCHALVGIAPGHEQYAFKGSVDSLNVGVAAAVLVARMLKA